MSPAEHPPPVTTPWYGRKEGIFGSSWWALHTEILAAFLLPLFDFKYFTQTLNWFMQNVLLLTWGIVLFKKHTINSKKNFFKVHHPLSSSVKQCPYLLNNNVELNLPSIICMNLGCYSLRALMWIRCWPQSPNPQQLHTNFSVTSFFFPRVSQRIWPCLHRRLMLRGKNRHIPNLCTSQIKQLPNLLLIEIVSQNLIR